MKRSEFLNALEQVMEMDEGTLNGDEVLAEIDEWDSISFLSVIAMLDEEFDVIIQGDKLESIHTVPDLIALVEDKLED